MADLERIGLALQGLSAGIGGQLPQFNQALGQRRKEQRALSLERRKAMATDALEVRRRLGQGNTVGAQELLFERVGAIEQLGGDSTETEALFNAINSANSPEGLQRVIAELDDDLQNFQSQGLFGAPKPEARTSLAKNLISSGLVEGSPEFQQAITDTLAKGGQTINVGGPDIGEEQKALAKSNVKTLETFRSEREDAITINQSLDVLDNIDVNTGALEPMKQGLAAFGAGFGIDTSALANISAGEAFNAVAKRIVLSVKATQKGPQTDQDEDTIRATVSSLGNSKEGNQFIVDSARALSNRKIERADFFDNYLETEGKLAGANRAWSKFKRNTPMVSPVLKNNGLPVFFYKFAGDIRSLNPDATNAEVLTAWRDANKKKGR